MSKPVYPIHSYPWYVHDWRQSMMRLRLAPIGRYVYRELLDQCYIDGSIPNEIELLAKIVDLPVKEFEKHWPAVKRAFRSNGDGSFHHPRVDDVLTDLERWREQKSNAGRESGRSRRARVERTLNSRSTAVEPSTTTTTTTSVQLASWPASIEFVRKMFPDTSDSRVAEIVAVALQGNVSISDEQLAAALQRAVKPKQQSAGLFKYTIGAFVQSMFPKSGPKRRVKCELCGDSGIAFCADGVTPEACECSAGNEYQGKDLTA